MNAFTQIFGPSCAAARGTCSAWRRRSGGRRRGSPPRGPRRCAAPRQPGRRGCAPRAPPAPARGGATPHTGEPAVPFNVFDCPEYAAQGSSGVAVRVSQVLLRNYCQCPRPLLAADLQQGPRLRELRVQLQGLRARGERLRVVRGRELRHLRPRHRWRRAWGRTGSGACSSAALSAPSSVHAVSD